MPFMGPLGRFFGIALASLWILISGAAAAFYCPFGITGTSMASSSGDISCEFVAIGCFDGEAA